MKLVQKVPYSIPRQSRATCNVTSAGRRHQKQAC